jgi:hypothetical protein
MKAYVTNTGYPAVTDNKIKHFIISDMMYTGEINAFSDTGTHRFSYVLNIS